MKLQARDQDFRDLLPKIDRAVFVLPFRPSKVWKSLGNEYNFKQWRRILKRYRVELRVDDSNEWDVVWGVYETDDRLIQVYVIEPEKEKLYKLKFRLIQLIMHEMVHANQFFAHEKQCWKVIEKQSTEALDYMCTFGELDAFAHCITLEHLECVADFENAYRLFDNATPKARKLLIQRIWRWMNLYS